MAIIRTRKQRELKKKLDRKNEMIKKIPKGLKSLGKKALKATPPGMMLTAAQKLKQEFGRLTKPKKPKNPSPPKNPRPNKTKPAPKIKNPRPDKRRPGGPGRPRRKK